MQLAAHVLQGTVAGTRGTRAQGCRQVRPPSPLGVAEGRGQWANWMLSAERVIITDKTEPAQVQGHSGGGEVGVSVASQPICGVPHWVMPAQVSTKISTTCSNSPRSDLQPEPGGGAAAEDKASSPSP